VKHGDGQHSNASKSVDMTDSVLATHAFNYKEDHRRVRVTKASFVDEKSPDAATLFND
jgi:hypothetical protein